MSEHEFDVAIIGGGAIGVSTAYHLSTAYSDLSVGLFEADRIASQSTGRAAGGIRQQFSTEIVTRLMMESVDLFEEYQRETDKFELRQNGYLFLATSEEETRMLGENVDMQQSLGLDVRAVSCREISELIPYLETGDIQLGTFCPTDGFSDPHSVATWFADEAAARGVDIHETTPVLDIECNEESVQHVHTDTGVFGVGKVLNAAGVWANEVGSMVGQSYPVEPQRIQLGITDDLEPVSPADPVVVDYGAHVYFRPERRSLLVGGSNENDVPPADLESYDTSHDFAFVEQVTDVLLHRLPSLSELRFVDGWAGLKGVTPDGLPIVDANPELSGYIAATGFNGHGFMLSPILGRELASYLATGCWNEFDLGAFSPGRFTAGQRNGAVYDDFML